MRSLRPPLLPRTSLPLLLLLVLLPFLPSSASLPPPPTFTSSTLYTPPTSASSSLLRAALLADVTSDSAPDLLFRTTSHVWTWPNRAVSTLGKQLFVESDLQASTILEELRSEGAAARLHAADLNRDGVRDVVYAQSGGFGMLNMGMGGEVTGLIRDDGVVDVADVNGDGRADLCHVVHVDNDHDVLRWNRNVPITYPTKTMVVQMPGELGLGLGAADTSMVVCVDLDGDGAPDAVCANDGALQVVRQVPDADDELISFASTGVLDSGLSGVTRVRVVDLDEDSRPDIVISLAGNATETTAGGLAWYRNLGGASFAAREDLLVLDVGESVADFELCAFCGRAKNLAYVTSDALFVALHNDAAPTPGDGHVFDFSAATEVNTYDVPLTSVLVADIDGDGEQDIVAHSLQGLFLELNQGCSPSMFSSSPSALPSVGNASAPTVFAAAGHLNDDDQPDVVVVKWDSPTSRLACIFADGSTHTIAASDEVRFDLVHLGDVNGDNFTDVVFLSHSARLIGYYANLDGLGTSWSTLQVVYDFFSEENELAPADFVLADVNGDLRMDVVTSTALVFHQQPTSPGTFAQVRLNQTVIATDAGASLLHVAACDFDGDGLIDIALSSSSVSTTTGVSVHAFLTSLQGRSGVPVNLDTDSSPLHSARIVDMQCADLFGHGSFGLVAVTTQPTSRIVFFDNRVGNGLTWEPTILYEAASSSVSLFAVQPLDADGDGLIDFAVASSEGTFVVLNRGDVFDDTPIWITHEHSDYVIAVDRDQDGDLDIITSLPFSEATTNGRPVEFSTLAPDLRPPVCLSLATDDAQASDVGCRGDVSVPCKTLPGAMVAAGQHAGGPVELRIEPGVYPIHVPLHLTGFAQRFTDLRIMPGADVVLDCSALDPYVASLPSLYARSCIEISNPGLGLRLRKSQQSAQLRVVGPQSSGAIGGAVLFREVDSRLYTVRIRGAYCDVGSGVGPAACMRPPTIGFDTPGYPTAEDYVGSALVTIGDAQSSTFGACAAVTDSPGAHISGMRFENCRTNSSGGALYISDSDQLMLYDMSFESNSAYVHGGALAVFDASSVAVELSTFHHCSAGTRTSDPLPREYSTLAAKVAHINDTQLRHSASGGAIFYGGLGGRLQLGRVNVTSCAASACGAVMLIGTGSATSTFQDCLFEGNTATGDVLLGAGSGGAVCASGSGLDLIKSNHFLSNAARGFGGGLFVSSGSVITAIVDNSGVSHAGPRDSGCFFDGCSGSGPASNSSDPGNGGGNDDLDNGRDLKRKRRKLAGIEVAITSSASRFEYNVATERAGGAIYCSTSSIQLQGTVLRHNSAVDPETGAGGALAADSCSIDLLQSHFLSNSAGGAPDRSDQFAGGGGIACFGDESTFQAFLYLRFGVFDGNSALNQGGAIRSVNCQTEVDGTVFAENRVAVAAGVDPVGLEPLKRGGGALHFAGNRLFAIADSVLENNTAEVGHGGAIFLNVRSPSPSIRPRLSGTTRVRFNAAPRGTGGGLYWQASTLAAIDDVAQPWPVALDSAVVQNNSALSGHNTATNPVRLVIVDSSVVHVAQAPRQPWVGNLTVEAVDAYGRRPAAHDAITLTLEPILDAKVTLLGATRAKLLQGRAQFFSGGSLRMEAKPNDAYDIRLAVGQTQPEDDKSALLAEPSSIRVALAQCLPGAYVEDDIRCASCPPGRFSNISGLFECFACPPGMFQEFGGKSSCEACPGGMFSSGAGRQTCSECPVGKFSPPAGGARVCTSCPPGYAASDSNQDHCEPCEPGSAAASPGSAVCPQCPVGEFMNEGNATSCLKCPKGLFSNITGGTTCEACPEGASTSVEGSITCELCPQGRFSDLSGASGDPLAAIECKLCGPGLYNDVGGATECKECEPGRFSSISGAGACTLCIQGTFSNTSGLPNCYQCPVGKRQSGIGEQSCIECEAGRFSPSPGGVACIDCPAGRFGANDGQSSCDKCLLGFFANQSASVQCHACPIGASTAVEGSITCQPCSAGRFAQVDPECPTCSAPCEPCPLGFVSVKVGQTSCTQCPSGSSTPVPGSVSCDLCPAGKFAQVNETETVTEAPCVPCPAGYFSDEQGLLQCKQCPAGKFANLQGSVACVLCPPGFASDRANASQCEPCAVGRFANASGSQTCATCSAGEVAFSLGSTSCSECASGRFATSPTTCDPCPRGKFNSESGRTDCEFCDAGRFSDLIGAVSCTNCSQGFVAGGTGATRCTACDRGKFAGGSGLLECEPCPSGEVAFSLGSTSCSECASGRFATSPTTCDPCPRGKFNSESGRTDCEFCDAGRFSDLIGAVSCTNCSQGFVAGGTGATRCTACDSGKFAFGSGLVECEACAPGKSAPNTGSTSCGDCPSGLFSASATTCAACPPGSVTIEPGSQQCELCEPGRFSSISGGVSCVACGAGTYQPSSNASTCLRCPRGRYAPSSTSTECLPCEPGSSQPSRGQDRCLACPAGQYQPDEEQLECLTCPRGRFAAATGRVSCDRCEPSEGRFQRQQGSSSCETCTSNEYLASESIGCVPCPDGAICDGSQAVARSGFYVLRRENATAQVFRCASGMCEGSGQCAASRKPDSFLCADCLEGHVELGNRCEECREPNVGIIAVFVLVYFAVILWLQIITADQGTQAGVIMIFILFGQVASVSFDLSGLAFFNFDPTRSACSIPFSPLDFVLRGFYLPLFMLVIVSVLLLFNIVAHCSIVCSVRRVPLCRPCLSSKARKRDKRMSFKLSRFYRTAAVVLHFSFMLLTETFVTMLDCREIGGRSVLRSVPSVRCDDARFTFWQSMVTLMWLFTFLLLCAVIVARRLCLGRVGMTAEKYQERCGFFSNNFKANRYFWFIVIYTMRVLVVCIVVISETDRARHVALGLLFSAMVFLQMFFQPFKEKVHHVEEIARLRERVPVLGVLLLGENILMTLVLYSLALVSMLFATDSNWCHTVALVLVVVMSVYLVVYVLVLGFFLFSDRLQKLLGIRKKVDPTTRRASHRASVVIRQRVRRRIKNVEELARSRKQSSTVTASRQARSLQRLHTMYSTNVLGADESGDEGRSDSDHEQQHVLPEGSDGLCRNTCCWAVDFTEPGCVCWNPWRKEAWQLQRENWDLCSRLLCWFLPNYVPFQESELTDGTVRKAPKDTRAGDGSSPDSVASIELGRIRAEDSEVSSDDAPQSGASQVGRRRSQITDRVMATGSLSRGPFVDMDEMSDEEPNPMFAGAGDDGAAAAAPAPRTARASTLQLLTLDEEPQE